MRRMMVRAVVVVTAVALFGLIGSGASAPGEIDTTFGVDGVVTTDIGSIDYAGHIVLQPDGKILVAGVATTDSWALVRYLPDGSLDESFGVAGTVVTQAPGGIASALTLTPDGKIVVAGRGVVARYLSTGSLDESFGTGGMASVGLSNLRLSAIEVFPNGSMLVAGTRSVADGSDFLVIRLTPSGALDPAFGEGGSVITDLGGSDAASALLVLPNQKFVVVGERADTGADFALVRYLPDGSLDSSFGSGGKVITNIGGWDHGDSAVLTSGGKIVVTGASYPNIALARYLPDGSLDPTFGTGGIVVSVTGEAWSVAQQSDGKLVVPTGTLAVARFTADGALDSNFGVGGIADAGLSGAGRAVAVDAEGKVIVAGDIEHDFALVRYLGDPVPPQNDAFADALTLNSIMTAPLAGTNLLATKEIGEPPHGSDEGGASVWYTWMPPFSGTGFVSTEGSDFDTTLGVYVGSSVSSLVTLASDDDDHQLNSSSRACFTATAGTPYQIAVDGYAAGLGYEGAFGNIELRWGEYTSLDPCPTLPPTVTGVPKVGSALAATNGTWAGSPAAFDYQWMRCRGMSCSTIPGAVGATYTPTTADVGANLIIRVTAQHPTDSSLNSINYSTRTDPVPAPPAPPPSGGGGGGGNSVPDLRLSLSASRTALVPGEESDIVATVANNGGAGSLHTHLAISLPGTVTLLGPPAYERGSGCTGTQTIDCYLDYIPNGGSTKVVFAVQVNGDGAQTIKAVASSDREANPADNSASVTLTVTTPSTPPPLITPPPKTPVTPVIAKPHTVPAVLRAGQPATVSFGVTRSDNHARLTSGRMICDPSVGGRVIRHTERFAGGVARLHFVVPKTAKGKLLKVRLTIRLGTHSTIRLATYRVR